MSESSELGKLGENIAAEHLRKHGYCILAQNFRSKSKAELDIVATKGDQIIFVEVKTRESNFMNNPALMVPLKKQRQIMKAANGFIKGEGISLQWRFDIISIVHNHLTTTINHIEDAFYPSLTI
jgi:putative endonuclease